MANENRMGMQHPEIPGGYLTGQEATVLTVAIAKHSKPF